jgi:hypothetical protein
MSSLQQFGNLPLEDNVTILIQQPSGSFLVRSNRAIRLSYERRCIEVWENNERPGWGERWMKVADITRAEDCTQWFKDEDLPGDDDWVAVAYFWQDLLDDQCQRDTKAVIEQLGTGEPGPVLEQLFGA